MTLNIRIIPAFAETLYATSECLKIDKTEVGFAARQTLYKSARAEIGSRNKGQGDRDYKQNNSHPVSHNPNQII